MSRILFFDNTRAHVAGGHISYSFQTFDRVTLRICSKPPEVWPFLRGPKKEYADRFERHQSMSDILRREHRTQVCAACASLAVRTSETDGPEARRTAGHRFRGFR